MCFNELNNLAYKSLNNTDVEAALLDEFCNLFNLKNLIKTVTCFTKNHNSTIESFF